jgi:hypothetical protein
MKKRNVLLVSLVLLSTILFSACAAAKTESQEVGVNAPMADGDFDYAMEEEMMAADDSGESSRTYDAGVGVDAQAAERMVIYNADMRIAVEDPTSALDSIIAMAEDSGGFVVSSNIYQSTTSSGRSVPRGNVTIRVPAGQLDSIMSAIKGLTPVPSEDVLSENVSGQDVTSEYTDLESQLRNLEAAEQALTEIMENATDTEDVLDVFDELTYYRGQIEMVKGRMQYLSESAALSAISVEIVAKESLQPIEIAGWQPQGTAKKAVEALINAAQKLADILIVFVIAWLPFLALFGAVIYFFIRLLTKGAAKRKAKKREALEQLPEEEVQK